MADSRHSLKPVSEDRMPFFQEAQLDQIAQELSDSGVAIRPGFLPLEWVRGAREEMVRTQETFREASVGKKPGLHPEIRSDRTQWWERIGKTKGILRLGREAKVSQDFSYGSSLDDCGDDLELS